MYISVFFFDYYLFDYSGTVCQREAGAHLAADLDPPRVRCSSREAVVAGVPDTTLYSDAPTNFANLNAYHRLPSQKSQAACLSQARCPGTSTASRVSHPVSCTSVPLTEPAYA